MSVWKRERERDTMIKQKAQKTWQVTL
uniref:Uncharacterized protein n=1 Tax=Anguilla anguilla TaxID=7936 RepID=A0A0E9PJ42_ANGAN